MLNGRRMSRDIKSSSNAGLSSAISVVLSTVYLVIVVVHRRPRDLRGLAEGGQVLERRVDAPVVLRRRLPRGHCRARHLEHLFQARHRKLLRRRRFSDFRLRHRSTHGGDRCRYRRGRRRFRSPINDRFRYDVLVGPSHALSEHTAGGRPARRGGTAQLVGDLIAENGRQRVVAGILGMRS